MSVAHMTPSTRENNNRTFTGWFSTRHLSIFHCENEPARNTKRTKKKFEPRVTLTQNSRVTARSENPDHPRPTLVQSPDQLFVTRCQKLDHILLITPVNPAIVRILLILS